MLFLDGVYVDSANGSPTRFRWLQAPTNEELTQLAHAIAHRIARFLERQGLLEQDVENSTLASDAVDEDPMDQLRDHSITYHIAVEPQAGRKVFTLQTLPAGEPEENFTSTVGKVAGFSPIGSRRGPQAMDGLFADSLHAHEKPGQIYFPVN